MPVLRRYVGRTGVYILDEPTLSPEGSAAGHGDHVLVAAKAPQNALRLEATDVMPIVDLAKGKFAFPIDLERTSLLLSGSSDVLASPDESAPWACNGKR